MHVCVCVGLCLCVRHECAVHAYLCKSVCVHACVRVWMLVCVYFILLFLLNSQVIMEGNAHVLNA